MADGSARDVVLVTGRHMRRPDPEIHLLVAALEQQSIDVVVRPWDDATAWASVPLVVVRSPWDYTDAYEEFLSWARSVAAVTRLVNPLDVLEWNSHKSYLFDLGSAGVPTVATTLVHRYAAEADQAHALAAYPGEIVIKPAVGRCDRCTPDGVLFARGRIASRRPHVDRRRARPATRLCRARRWRVVTRLFRWTVQSCNPQAPRPGDYRVQEHYGGRVVPHEPTDDEFAVAAAALAAAPAATAYARVDLVHVAGSAAVMELEAIEPQLFLDHDAHAAARFAGHIMSLLR